MKILTFDIEEWFHILDNDSTKGEKEWANYECRIHKNMETIFRLLEENNTSATFFCMGWIAKKYPEIIKKIEALGYEIGTHSNLHQLAYQQSRKEYKSDLEYSIKHLEDLIGKKVTTYRAPGFSIKEENKWAFEELIKNGITIDCSVFPAKRSHGGFSSFGSAEPCWIDIDGHRLKEFPINLKTVLGRNIIFSGGGYFRLFPEFALTKLFSSADYVMTYFHPRDFDYNQPRIKELGKVRLFKSYYGLSRTYGKLNSILEKFNFFDIRTADASLDWSNIVIKNF